MNARTTLLAALIAVLLGLNVYQYSRSQTAAPTAAATSEMPHVSASAPDASEGSVPAEAEDAAGDRDADAGGDEAPAQPVPQKIAQRFHRAFVKSRALLKNSWFGIKTWQHPFDAWITQEIIWEVKPDFIVETGTFHGGSAALWATLIEHTNPEGRVISIDAFDFLDPAVIELPVVKRRVEFLRGSSSSPETFAEVEKRVKGKKVLVILDSDHHKEHVLGEMRGFAPMVSVGSYLIVQDTHLGDSMPFWMLKTGRWDPGPMKAIDAFMETNQDFEIDASRERLAATNNHRGFLKRIR